MVALAPAASVPSAQVVAVHVPSEGVAETSVNPAGSVPVRLTFVAFAGPWLVTVIVSVTVVPTSTGSGASSIVTSRSASVAAATTVFAAARLFAVLRSGTLDDTVGALARLVPGPSGPSTTATMLISASPPGNSVGVGQVMSPRVPTAGVVQVVSAGAVSDAKVVPPGSASMVVTPVASTGPLSCTRSV